MTVRLGKWETWRHCCKGTVIFVVGPLVFLVALVMQAGMLKLSDTYSRHNPLRIALDGIRPSEQIPFSSNGRSIDANVNSTCLSRLQHMLHRSPSQVIPPSPAFIEALTAYEKHHAHCSRSAGQNWTKTFAEYGAQLHGQDVDNQDGCKYLVYMESGAGLGNRFMSLLSAVVYALLTNRVILLSSGGFKGHVAEMLCEPFENSSWLLPTDFPLYWLDIVPNLGGAIHKKFQNMTTMKLQLDHTQDWGDSRFFCEETRKEIESVPWVVYNSNQYYVPRMFTFSEFWPQLALLFPNPSHTFTHLSRHFLLPNNLIWEKIIRIHDSYLASADTLVGVQIRRHSPPDGRGDFSDAAMDRILSCLVAHDILPKVAPIGGLSEQMLKRMDGRASATVVSGKLKMNKVEEEGSKAKTLKYAEGVTSVLVASLEQKYAQTLEELYTNNPTADGRLVRVHMVSHDGMEWHSFDQSQKAFIEMWLLSLSDFVVTSSWSTFGYVAQGLGAIRPYLVALKGDLSDSNETAGRLDLDPLQDATIPNLHCALGQSFDPCNHFPFYPKTDCKDNGDLHFTPAHEKWLQKHFLPCQDEIHGRQLVS